MATEQATRQLKAMTFEDCIELWNNKAVDHYARCLEIHPMSDTDWWEWLSDELGAWELVQAALGSAGRFNDSDKFFFYEEYNECLVSFSTKQEMIEAIGQEWFIEALLSEDK